MPLPAFLIGETLQAQPAAHPQPHHDILDMIVPIESRPSGERKRSRAGDLAFLVHEKHVDSELPRQG